MIHRFIQQLFKSPVLALATSGILATSLAVDLPLPPAEALSRIQPSELRMHLEFLSSRELGGRYALSPSLEVVNRYLASRLRAYGFKGALDGDFLQHYDVESLEIRPEASQLTVSGRKQPRRFDYGEFFLSAGGGGSFRGEVVFVGHGPDPEERDALGLEVAGRVVLMLPDTAGDPIHSSTASRLTALQERGAVGALILPSQRDKRRFGSRQFRRYLGHPRFRLANGSPTAIRAVTIGPEVAKPVLEALNTTLPQLLAGSIPPSRHLDLKVDVNIAAELKRFRPANVVGVLEGSDPLLRSEYVVISAHQDHLESDDGVYFPGADDDGSGVAAILNLAKVFGPNPPRRSILVIFHSSEESGLLGSRYNTDVEPVVPIDQLIVNLNVDMIGRSRQPGDDSSSNSGLSDSNTVYVIGADKISRQLHEINVQTNQELEQLRFDYSHNDLSRPERIYYRSDHWNYARHGVPVVFFFTGLHSDYHQASDTIDKIDFQKLTRMTRHLYALSWRLAQMDSRLGRDVVENGAGTY